MERLAIIEKVKSGQTDYFERIVRQYNTTLFRIGLGYLRKDEDIEDMMQNTYLKAYQNLHLFRNESSFTTWLIRIMINECLMFLRKATKGKRDHSDVIQYPSSRNPLDILAQQELKGLIERSVKKLPAKYRIVYLLRSVEARSIKETAEVLEISEDNVKVRLHRANEILKDHILQEVDTTDLFEYYAPRCDVLTAKVMRQIRKNAG